MSSGQLKKKHPMNKMLIKDGWIVTVTKEGRIKARIEPWAPNPPKKKAI